MLSPEQFAPSQDHEEREHAETERAFNRNLRGERNAFGSPEAARLRLSDSVGIGHDNHAADVTQVQRGLGTLGFIPLSRGFEPNGVLDGITGQGIRSFQQSNGLHIDGALFPKGETETAMNDRLRFFISGEGSGDMLAVPPGAVDREPLSPPKIVEPKIPGTNIPDRGIPEEGWPGSGFSDPFNYFYFGNRDKGFDRKPPAIDPRMEIPHNPDISEWDI